MKTFRFIGMTFMAIMLCVNFTACGDDDEEGDGGYKLSGTAWTQDGDDDVFCFLNGGEVVTYENYTDYKNGDKAYHMKWSVSGDVLTLTYNGYFENGTIVPENQSTDYYQIASFSDNKMVLKLIDSDDEYAEIGEIWTFNRLK